MAKRTDVKTAHDHVAAGSALLVCAYDDQEKCRQYHLDGAMDLSEFRTMADSLPKDKEIDFYCA